MIRIALALIDFELLFLPVTVKTIEKTRNVETTSLRGKRAKATESAGKESICKILAPVIRSGREVNLVPRSAVDRSD